MFRHVDERDERETQPRNRCIDAGREQSASRVVVQKGTPLVTRKSQFVTMARIIKVPDSFVLARRFHAP